MVMKKIFLILFFAPIVCFAEIKYLDESSLTDEQLKKFEERLDAEQKAGFDPSKPYKVVEESGPWEEYAKEKLANSTSAANKEYSLEEIETFISNDMERRIKYINKSNKDNDMHILERDELVAIINELIIKINLLNERYSRSNVGRLDLEKNLLSVRENPYSISNTNELIIASSSAFALAYISSSEDLQSDISFIHKKIVSHTRMVNVVRDSFLFNLLHNGKLVKK